MAAARIQRWALFLNAYDYDIEYIEGKKNATADVLSRLPLSKTKTTGVEHDAVTVMCLKQVDSLPILASQLEYETVRDPILGKVLKYVLNGWPETISVELQPYFQRRYEFSVEQNCLFWGMRVVIPLKLRQQIVKELHMGHPGIVRMKALAIELVA